MANAAKLYKAMLDGLEYRGTAFFQCYTTCQPEHGVGDNMSADQAKLVRDARGMPEFVFNPRKGETSQEAFDLKGNPTLDRDWWRTKFASTGEEYNFTVAHWAHHRRPLPQARQGDQRGGGREAASRSTTCCSSSRRTTSSTAACSIPTHRSFVPNFGCYIKAEINGKMKYYAVTRQMVLFAVERRKAWRMLQSKAGVVNKDYLAQKAFLAKVDKGEISSGRRQGARRGACRGRGFGAESVAQTCSLPCRRFTKPARTAADKVQQSDCPCRLQVCGTAEAEFCATSSPASRSPARTGGPSPADRRP